MEFKSKKQICYTKSGSNKAYFSFHLKIVEVNESWFIVTFEVRGSNKKIVFAYIMKTGNSHLPLQLH